MMTAPPVARVDIGRLRLGAELGRGRHGKVAAVRDLLIGGRWPAAVKIYSLAMRGAVDVGVLEKLIAFPADLPPDDKRWLAENTSWPAAIAEHSGIVYGFLMRAAPAGLVRRDGANLALSRVDRLRRLRSLASALTRMHELGIVVGDLSSANVLFSVGSPARCFLIGCDAMQLKGELVLGQVETPGWEMPVGEARLTMASDAYKLGLLAIRLFADNQGPGDASGIAAVSAELGRLASLSQHLDPMRRPSPGTWIAAIDRAVH
jgi:eukaryotic-like serine/threonine-protein kinase